MPKITFKVETAGIDHILLNMKRADAIAGAAARNIEKRAKASMRGGGQPHVPSAPGEPPHIDTGALVNSIRVDKVKDALYDVQDGVEYGIHLELGTAHMAERPWLTPAFEAERKAFEEAMRKLFAV